MSKWRQLYKVHPAADVFPPMPDDELAALGEDIKANGIKTPITFIPGPGGNLSAPILIDGRNRLEAMERAGILDNDAVLSFADERLSTLILGGDPVAHIIGLNIHRRHLTKQQQADLIVAARKASRKVCEVPKRHVKGKAGSEKDEFKAAVVADCKKHDIGSRTAELAIAKSKGKTPAKSKGRTPKVKTQPEEDRTGAVDDIFDQLFDDIADTAPNIEAARTVYLNVFDRLGGRDMAAEATTMEAELKRRLVKILDEVKTECAETEAIADSVKKAVVELKKNGASTLPQDREGTVDDPAPTEKIEVEQKPDDPDDGCMVRLIDGKVWVTTECGFPQYETPFTKVEDYMAALEARVQEVRARTRRRRKKNRAKAKAVSANGEVAA